MPQQALDEIRIRLYAGPAAYLLTVVRLALFDNLYPVSELYHLYWNIEKTEGILEEIRVREGFKEFLAMAVLRFMTKDWGAVEPEDAAHNNKNPQF